MRAAIIDDLESCREELRKCLHQYLNEHYAGETPAVGEFSSGEDFLSQFQPEAWDVIFIDQYMDGLSGIDTARKIREKDKLAVLVFVVLWLWLGKVEWVVFPCFVPAALITYLVLNSVFFNGRGNLYVVLGLVASVFAVGYLVLLRFGMNFWQLFLILIPAEAVVYFSFNIRAKH